MPSETTLDPSHHALEELRDFVARHKTLTVLSGAGCSTQSGIADYRDRNGEWKRVQPIQYQDFVAKPSSRQRYWARSMVGWRHIAAAEPNEAHYALTALEQCAKLHCLVTQNVDGLHQRAGSTRVIDLHGRLDNVICLSCKRSLPRRAMQDTLLERNPTWHYASATFAPDGDADLEGADFSDFQVPDCGACGGMLKPDVVFFGENVPRTRVENAHTNVAHANALLVVGSSLMVFSGYRFVRAALERNQPVAILNVGHTRADSEVALKIELPCGPALSEVVAKL